MTERSAHQCHRDNCDSAATVGVDLHLNCCTPGVVRSIGMKCTIQTCDRHKDDVRGYLLSEQNKETIRTTLMEQGLPEPDFLSARIEFVPIEQPKIVVQPEIVGCDRAGCTNPAKWRIRQVFVAGGSLATALTNIFVCNKHKRETKPRHLLKGADRARTMAFLNKAHVPSPDLDGMLLEFVALDTGEPETLPIKVNADGS